MLRGVTPIIAPRFGQEIVFTPKSSKDPYAVAKDIVRRRGKPVIIEKCLRHYVKPADTFLSNAVKASTQRKVKPKVSETFNGDEVSLFTGEDIWNLLVKRIMWGNASGDTYDIYARNRNNQVTLVCEVPLVDDTLDEKVLRRRLKKAIADGDDHIADVLRVCLTKDEALYDADTKPPVSKQKFRHIVGRR